MVEESYKKALRDAREELLKLLPQKERIDKRVAQLRQTVASLSALCDEEVGEHTRSANAMGAAIEKVYSDLMATMTGRPGITDATRAVLRTFNRPMTATEVRDGLVTVGYDLSGQSNVYASLTSILKRLVESGEVEPSEKDGKNAYQWKGATRVVPGGMGRGPKPVADELREPVAPPRKFLKSSNRPGSEERTVGPPRRFKKE